MTEVSNLVLKLTEQEELELVKQYQQNGDIRALKKLQISLRPLIRSTIKRRMPGSGEMSEAQIATRITSILPKALKEYDLNSGVKLNTYLINRIDGNAWNAISENKIGAHVPRPEHSQLFRYQQARRQAQLEFGKNPTPEQILKMDSNLKDVEEVKRIAQYDKKTYIGDTKHGNESDGFVSFKDQFTSGFDSSKDQELSLQLDSMREIQKNDFNEEEQKIIEEYIFNERTLLDTALRVGVTTSRVRTVTGKWKKKLKEKGIT